MNRNYTSEIADYLEKRAEYPIRFVFDSYRGAFDRDWFDGAPWFCRNLWLVAFLLSTPLIEGLPGLRGKVIWLFWITYWLAWALDVIQFRACLHKFQVNRAIEAEMGNHSCEQFEQPQVKAIIATIKEKFGRNRYAVAIGALERIMTLAMYFVLLAWLYSYYM